MDISSTQSSTIITFYSYKGGTGRSMAVANIAYLLAQRVASPSQRILVMDWDLEAPGLHRFFAPRSEESENVNRPGVIDYFYTLQQLLSETAGLYEEIVSAGGWKFLDRVLPLEDYLILDVVPAVPGIDLMKAGRLLDSQYAEIVSSFDWAGFYDQFGSVVEVFRELLASRYAYCLIDSRTGFTDISGICTMLLPEKLVAVFTPNRQSLYGLLDLVAQAVEYRRSSDDFRPLAVFPLPSRIDLAEELLREQWREEYQRAFEDLFRRVYEIAGCDLSAYFDEVQLPHVSYYAYGEEIAVLERERSDALSLRRRYEEFFKRLVELDFAWEALAKEVPIPIAPRVRPSVKTGRELERRVADAYRLMGAWKVEHDVELAGNQIDVYVELETPGRLLHRLAVEAKDWSNPVGIDVVHGFMQIVERLRRGRLIDEGVLVSPAGFTKPARIAAETYGIRLLEPADLEAMVTEAKEVRRAPPPARPVPLPPTLYIAHPYPAQEHFTGRERERANLTAWLADDAYPLLAVIAIGGMGKSALGWHWLQEDLLPLGLEHWGLRGALWWCFYDQESSFERFLERAIAYVSGGEMDASNWPVRDRMDCLRALLSEGRFLLVLDGVERLLRAYTRVDTPYLVDEVGDKCADPNVGIFFQWLAELEATKTLLISRLLPRELEGLAGVARTDLTQMDPEDAVRFFRVMDIRGTRAEIQAACVPYGYLPLALRLLAGLVAEDPARPGDISVATDYQITEDLRGKEQHHILERAYDALDPAARELLSRIAAFRSPVGYGVLQAIFGPPSEETDEGEEAFRYEKERALKDALRGLVKRGLLLRQEGTGRYDLHPVVRRYAYDRLADKESIHACLRDFFAAVPAPRRVESLDDLAPAIELYHHTVRAGRYDEAYDLYYDRLSKPLLFRFGAYQLIIELLRALFPDGEPFTPSGEVALPCLGEEGDRAWTLNMLAQSYAMSGRPGRAVPGWEAAAVLEEKQDNRRNLAISLMNIATQQLAIGALAAAERNLRRDIELTREIGEEFHEALGHLEMSLLLAYTGAFEEAEQELETALASFGKLGATQSECVVWAYRALRALLMDDTKAALEAARQARELADVRGYERDIIRTEWLLGAAHRARGELAQAEPRLEEALRRCRRINMIDHEPNILLELARLRHAQAQEEKVRRTSEVRRTWEAEALSLAQEALDIADRCQYRLVQADCHNFLAELALEAGDRQKAQGHAETARERAWCDGPPHRYEAAFQEAERLLERIASDAERARRS